MGGRGGGSAGGGGGGGGGGGAVNAGNAAQAVADDARAMNSLKAAARRDEGMSGAQFNAASTQNKRHIIESAVEDSPGSPLAQRVNGMTTALYQVRGGELGRGRRIGLPKDQAAWDKTKRQVINSLANRAKVKE